MTESNRRWAHIHRAVNFAVALAMLALAVSMTGTIVSLRNDAKTERTTVASVDDVRSSERWLCYRVQRLRNQSNTQARVIYVTLTTVTTAARQRGSRFTRLYARLAREVTFTPPTDCIRAVNDPMRYRSPAPVRFADCAVLPPDSFSGCLRRRG